MNPRPVVPWSGAVHWNPEILAADRLADAAMIANYLTAKPPNRCGCTAEQRDRTVQQHLAVLDRPDWRDAVRATDAMGWHDQR